MKKLTICVLLAGLLTLGGQAFAVMCAIDPVPAASLLLPYFEVDMDAPAPGTGIDTLFSINNASAAPTIAHVTIWSNMSIPIIDFDVFLTGYDVHTMSLYNILHGDGTAGTLVPRTAHSGNDGPDTISPHGDNPAWDSSPDNPANPLFPGCDDFLPYTEPSITGVLYERTTFGPTGQGVPYLGGACLGLPVPSGHAVGYMTVENVNDCNINFPLDVGFFQQGGTGDASNVNQLWGDWFIVDTPNNFAMGDTLVHVEADDAFDAFTSPTGYTFWGRFTANLNDVATRCDDGCDNREPLGTTWGARYLNGGSFDETDLLVWRDSTAGYAPSIVNGFACASPPDWYPMNETQVIAFNEIEDAVELCVAGVGGGTPSPPPPGDPDITCFPYETQRVSTATGEAASPFGFGWMYLNLNVDDTISLDYDPGFDVSLAQSWVGVNHQAQGRYSAGMSAIELTSACQDLSPLIVGNIPINP